MQRFSSMLSKLNELFSDTHQLQRIVIYLGIALVLAAVSFGSYYYYDRYYTDQVPVLEQSIAQAEQAVRDDPQNTTARLALAEVYMGVMRWDDAIAQAYQVQEVKPDDVNVDFILGISFANSGRCKEAIDPLGKYLKANENAEMLGLNRRYQAALYYMGDCYLQLDQPELAIGPLEANIGLSQTDADALYKLGLAYIATQKYGKAHDVLQKAVAFVPNFTEAYDAMARAYEEQGESDKAKYARAMVAYSQGDYKSAHASLLEVMQSQPTFAPVFVGMGLTCEAEEDLTCALDAYKVANQLNPADFTASQGLLRVEAALQQ